MPIAWMPNAAIDPWPGRWHRGGDMAPTPHRVNLRAALLALPLALAGCGFFSAPPEPRGNRAEADVLRDVTPGVASRNDVRSLLGSPSATGTFDDSRWYYISATSRTRIARTPGIENQRVVEVTFNPQGIVQGIRELGPEDTRSVNVVERTTPVPGNERSFLQALFGNIGRIGPTLPTQATAPGVANQ